MADSRSTAVEARIPVGVIGGKWMTSQEMKAGRAELGLSTLEFYFRGRCGVLGEVHPDVVTSAALFFPAARVAKHWTGGRAVPAEVAVARAAVACQQWGRRVFGGFDGFGDCVRLADLLEKVVAAASPLGAPLFAGWRGVPLPEDAPARAAQLVHLLRELRGGVHVTAVVASGLSPVEAILAAADFPGTPFGDVGGEAVARFFTWPEPYPAPTAEMVERRKDVEDRTDDLMAPAFAALSPAERDELIGLLRLGLTM